MAQEQIAAPEEWRLHSAAEAARELIGAIERLDVDGWAFSDEPLRGSIDLRGNDGVEIVPVVLPDGTVLGTIRHPAVRTGDPTDDVLRILLQTVVLLVAMERRGWAAADRARSAELESRHDPLTGLPNRRLWDEAAAQEEARCRRHGLKSLVAVVDLDGLKEANDQHGHLAGDVLLRMAADSLRKAVRDTDLVARVGGDEFALLAVEFEDGDPAAFAERVERTLAASGVSASVGVTVAEPGTSLSDAFERADRVMYDTKRSHRRSRSAS